MAASWCPRCGADLVAPGLYESTWRCAQHGEVSPLRTLHPIDSAALDYLRPRAAVPVWLIDPAPPQWQLCGLAYVGDLRTEVKATVTAYCGPAPLGGTGEWLIVAEEPGIGLGAAYARSDATATSAQIGSSPPAKIHAAGRPTSLWVAEAGDANVGAEDRKLSAYVGEARGVWIWLIGFPADAGYALLDDLSLIDARDDRVPACEPGPASVRLRPMH
jgi:hypothetical protein